MEAPLKVTVILLQIIKVLIFLYFMAIAFWALWRQYKSAAVRAIALYCFAMTAWMGLTIMPMYPAMASFQLPFQPSPFILNSPAPSSAASGCS